ncbi:MAG TPA: Mu transposase C-terminal domain-containing protein [Acetobacteraceae bacterium]|nr:Mu transposase C-terminal domain-containing protein [Acetobacteraceae bacterium]
MSSQFASGTLVAHAGAHWRVQRILSPEAVLLRSATGEAMVADPMTIQPPRVAPLARRAPLRDELHYSEAHWADAMRRRELLRALADRPARTTADVSAAAAELGVSPRRVWGLLRQMRALGDDVTQFLPARHGPRATKRLDPRVEAIVAHAIDQHYARRTRPCLQSLATEVARRCSAVGLAAPSAKTVRSRVRSCDQAWLVRRREGPRAARSARLLTGADRGASAPWERVQIDSTPCDIRLVREHDRTVIGRPNVTFAIDVFSRTVLGFSVSLQSASTVTVATCLAHACLPKREWLAQRDLNGIHCPVWGRPFILEYDQGPEHEAKGIQRGLRLHGIRSKVRAKGHPEHHGTIERLIGTLMRRVHERRGTTFSNINERGDAEPDQLACLSLPELEKILALEIDSYNHTTHEGIGDRPLDRYLAYYRQPALPEDQRVPPLLSAERLLLDFLPYERRRLVRTGFRLFRVNYSSRDLLAMWRRQNQALIERIVVYDPRNLAQVWVTDDATGDYVAVPYRVPRTAMTLAESEATRRQLRGLKAADRTESRLFENMLRVRSIEEHGRMATARMKAERSHQARRAAPTPMTREDAMPALLTRLPAPVTAPAVIEPFADIEDL